MSVSTTASTTARALRPRGQLVDYSNNGAGTPRKASLARPSPPASVASSAETAVRAPLKVLVKEDLFEVPIYDGISRFIQRRGPPFVLVGMMTAFLWFLLIRGAPIKMDVTAFTGLRRVSVPAFVNHNHNFAEIVAELKAGQEAIHFQSEHDRAKNEQALHAIMQHLEADRAMREQIYDDRATRVQDLDDMQQNLEDLQDELKALQAQRSQLAVSDTHQTQADIWAVIDAVAARQQEVDALRIQEERAERQQFHQQFHQQIREDLRADRQQFHESIQEERLAERQHIYEYVQGELQAERQQTYEIIQQSVQDELQAERQQTYEIIQKSVQESVQESLQKLQPPPPLANFASSFVARIINALTSRTFSVPSEGLRGFNVPGNPPITALESGVEPGQCWPMAVDLQSDVQFIFTPGTTGQLAISLLKPIIPSSITISHPAAATWTGVEGHSAMQDFELWAVYDEKRFKHLDLDAVTHFDPENVDQPSDAQIPAGIKLLSGTFDPNKPVERYFIEDNAAAKAYDIYGKAVPAVVLRIKSNHGHRDWTCIYNVQVHGAPS
ncbi:hypothetical protein HDU87_007478 [Geranomyces variabilis]|uniref:SUN domain-containing protein n=1 Tax=Geranomyces variabilis TaxID=109894 RepID=A0AAD5TPJ0_9FUNG|nr:hypothetical protein HDU87_007478 [Geranomyces variabilis]